MNLCFAVEKTLGKLAKWLRLLGFDTRFESARPKQAPERLSGRIFLTRTKRNLGKRNFSKCLLIESDHLDDQLREVVHALNITFESIHPFSRCIQCNTEIRQIEKEAVWGKVPDYVWETQDRFSLCVRCNRIYWSGSHFFRGMGKIAQLFGDSNGVKPNDP